MSIWLKSMQRLYVACRFGSNPCRAGENNILAGI